MPMNGTSYPLNLSEKCWALGLRTPEAIQKLYDDDKRMDKWSKDAMSDILRYAGGEDDAKKEVEKLKAENKQLQQTCRNKAEEYCSVLAQKQELEKQIAETDKKITEIADDLVKAYPFGGAVGNYTSSLDLISSWVEGKICCDMKEHRIGYKLIKTTETGVSTWSLGTKKEMREICYKVLADKDKDTSMFTREDYKWMFEKTEAERDYEHTRFLEEQIKRDKYESMARCYGDYVELINDGTFTEWMKEKHPDEIWGDCDEDSDDE